MTAAVPIGVLLGVATGIALMVLELSEHWAVVIGAAVGGVITAALAIGGSR